MNGQPDLDPANPQPFRAVSGITYTYGDATQPTEQVAVIAHVCNDIGLWGAGFVLALSSRDRRPEKQYREWFMSGERFGLGEVRFSSFGSVPGTYVANMVAQHGVGRSKESPPVRYDALASCLAQVAVFARRLRLPVVGPRFGSGLAGGDWATVETIIYREVVSAGVPVVIYDPSRQCRRPF